MKKIKVGLWGIGRSGWGMHVKEMRMYPDMFEIAACCDLIPERMKMVKDIFPECKCCPNASDMLNDPSVEFITVALRSPDHVAAGIRALEAGKIVMVDKPIAMNLSEARLLEAAGKRHPGKLFFRQTLRFEKTFQHIREIIDTGVLGRIFEIKLRRHGYYRRCDWQSIRACGGGILNNWGPHLIDHALQLMNYNVSSVWGETKLITATGDAEDHFHAILKSSNGCTADIAVSGGVAIPEPEYSIYGDRGAIVSENMKRLHIKYLDVKRSSPPQKATTETLPLDSPYRPSDGLVWIEKVLDVSPEKKVSEKDTYRLLYEKIRLGKPYPVKNEQAFANVLITEKIRRSAAYNKKRPFLPDLKKVTHIS